MKGFFCDLDGTLITRVSPELVSSCIPCRKNAPSDIPLDVIPPKAYSIMQAILSLPDVMMVPCTMRTVESYRSLNIDSHFKYALCEGSGVLLIDDVIDIDWYRRSAELIQPYVSMRLVISNICESYDCTVKCDTPFSLLYHIPSRDIMPALMKRLQRFKSDFDIVDEGNLLCINYRVLRKAYAVERFVERFNIVPYLSAGDSLHDVSMFSSTYYSVGHASSRLPVMLTESPIDFINKVLYECYRILRR